MSSIGFSGDNYAGNYATYAELVAGEPVGAVAAGRLATVGVQGGTVTHYICNGNVWNALVGLSSDGTALVSGDGILIPVVGGLSTTNSADAATANVAKLQSALTAGGLVQILAAGTYYVNDSLVMYSNSQLLLGPNVTIKSRAATNKSVIKNASFNAASTSVSIASSGRTATVTWTAHGKTAGDYVAILGANQASYNGVWQVATAADANTLTYTMFEAASATPATGTVTGRAADSNIRIIGGTIDMDEANQTVSGNNETHAVRIFNCYGGRIDTEVLNAKKYAVLLANVDMFDVPNLSVDTTSDGLHFMGPIGTVNVGTVEGKSGDDLVAFTMGDFATYEVCRGNIRNVTIEAIKPRYALTGLKIAGNPNCTVEFLKVGSISGTVRRQAIYFTNDTNLTETNTEYVEIGPVRVQTGLETANTYTGITIRGNSHKVIKIGQIHDLSSDTSDAVNLLDCTFGQVEIGGFYSRNTATKKHFNISGSATFTKWLKVLGIDVTPGDNASTMVMQVGGTVTIPRLVLSGVSVPVTGTNARLLQVAGTTATVTEVDYDNFTLTGGNSFFDQSVSGQPAPTIKMYNGTKGSGYATGLNLRDSATVMLSEMDWGTFTNRPIATGTTGTVEVFGSAKKLSARMINKGAGATVYATGHTFVCDTASHQTGRTGDMVTDVTSGKVTMYDGAAWTAVA